MKKITLVKTITILVISTLLFFSGVSYNVKHNGIKVNLKTNIRNSKNLLILPLNDGVSKKHMDSALKMLKKEFPKVNIIVGKKIKLPKNCLNYNKSRYRADSILVFLKKIKPDSVNKVIGLTSSDISTTRILMVNGEARIYADRGIFGLARCPGSVGVVSSYRTKTLEIFSKTTVHEFMHTLGVSHCEHKYCIMQDGKGSGKNMRESTHIHKECYDSAMKGF